MKTLLLVLSLVSSISLGQVTSADRCFGKKCKVKSLTFMGPGGTDIIQFANGKTIHTNNGDSNWIYTDSLRPSVLFSDSSVTAQTSVVASTFLETDGAATGSLPVCSAGQLETDSTLSTLTYCSGATRKTLATAGSMGFQWASYCEKSPCTKAETAADAFLMPLRGSASFTPTSLVVNWRTAGTGGTTGVVLAIFNATDSTELCSVTVGACTIASGVATAQNLSCGALLAGKAYVVRIKSTTDCTTIPGLIGVTVQGSQ